MHDVISTPTLGWMENFSDKEYTDKGAKLAYSKEEVFKSNFILKIRSTIIDMSINV